jgi:hypothetical protein
LFAGIVAPRPAFVPLGGTAGREHIRPEDTPDEDYGLLLERAYKGVASATGTETLWTLKRLDRVRAA